MIRSLLIAVPSVSILASSVEAKPNNMLEYSIEYISNTGSPSLLRSYKNFSNNDLMGYGIGLGYSSGLEGSLPYLNAGYTAKVHYSTLNLEESYDSGFLKIEQSQLSVFGSVRISSAISILRPFLELGVLIPLAYEGSIRTKFGRYKYSDEQYVKSSVGIMLWKIFSSCSPYLSSNFSSQLISPYSYEGIELGLNHEI